MKQGLGSKVNNLKAKKRIKANKTKSKDNTEGNRDNDKETRYSMW